MMPRRSSGGAGSPFDQIQQQARVILTTLREEIRAKEADLKRLKEEESRLALVTAEVSTASASARLTPDRTTGGRTNWRTVIERLPKQFKASDVRGIRGLKDKRTSEIFAAVTRWIDAGIVKRKERGLYERVS
jgi:hypothetical protein